MPFKSNFAASALLCAVTFDVAFTRNVIYFAIVAFIHKSLNDELRKGNLVRRFELQSLLLKYYEATICITCFVKLYQMADKVVLV